MLIINIYLSNKYLINNIIFVKKNIGYIRKWTEVG